MAIELNLAEETDELVDDTQDQATSQAVDVDDLIDGGDHNTSDQAADDPTSDGVDEQTDDAPFAADTPGIDGFETIDVPIRKAAKAEGKVRVVRTDDMWRTGWLLQSTKKKGGGEIGSQPLSVDRPGFGSKTEAVAAALTEMADCACGKDNRIVDDVLKFRDTDYFVAPASEDATEPAPGYQQTDANDPETIEGRADAEFSGMVVDDMQAAAAKEGGQVSAGDGQVSASGDEQPASDDKKTKEQVEAEHQQQVVDAAIELAGCAMRRRDLETQLKSAKAEEKLAEDEYRTLVERGPQHMPLFDSLKPAASNTPDKSSNDTAAAATSDEPLDGSTRPLDPLDSPLADLDLPAGIHDKLTSDGIDTIRRLEKRRADISMKREKWPAGIGKAAIDKIENAVLDWLKRNQQATANETTPAASEVANQVGDDPVAEPANEAVDDQPADDHSSDAPATIPMTPPGATSTTTPAGIAHNNPDGHVDTKELDKAAAKKTPNPLNNAAKDPAIGDVVARAAQLVDNGFEPDPNDPSYRAGSDAYRNAFELIDCPYVKGADQDKWLMGFQNAANQYEGT